jgi:hypothetical protein
MPLRVEPYYLRAGGIFSGDEELRNWVTIQMEVGVKGQHQRTELLQQKNPLE